MAFLWGQSKWGKVDEPKHPDNVIKVRLRKYGFTVPQMAYGFILGIGTGGILRAYDYEVTDFSQIEGRRFQYLGLFNDFRVYSEDELDELMSHTLAFGSNEIWVDGKKARITGAYVYRDSHARGRTIFEFKMKRAGIPLCLMY